MLGIPGSLRRASYNLALLDAAREVAPAHTRAAAAEARLDGRDFEAWTNRVGERTLQEPPFAPRQM